MMRASNPESMKDDAESTAYMASPSPDPPSTPALAQLQPLNISVFHEILFVGVVIMAQFLGLAGLGQSIAPMHIIADGLHVTNPGEQAWFAAAFSLTVGTFILVSGRLGDLFGWKRMLVIGYSWTALWSVVLGLSWYSNHVLFIFARVFQGVGPSICMPNGLALLGAIYASD